MNILVLRSVIGGFEKEPDELDDIVELCAKACEELPEFICGDVVDPGDWRLFGGISEFANDKTLFGIPCAGGITTEKIFNKITTDREIEWLDLTY